MWVAEDLKSSREYYEDGTFKTINQQFQQKLSNVGTWHATDTQLYMTIKDYNPEIKRYEIDRQDFVFDYEVSDTHLSITTNGQTKTFIRP